MKKGPKLEIIALSDYADFSKEGKVNIAGIFDEVYAEKLPASIVRCFVVFTVTGLAPKSTIKVRVVIEGSSGVLVEKELDGDIGKNGKGNFRLQILGLAVNEYGAHTISIFHDKELLGKTLYHVIKAENGVT